MELLTALITMVVAFMLIAAIVYIVCRIATPFIKEIICTAKEKNRQNALVQEAIKSHIQYYEKMAEVTQNEDLKNEYNEIITLLRYQLTEEREK